MKGAADMERIFAMKAHPTLKEEVIRMRIKDELRGELVTKELFNERMKGIDVQFAAVYQRFAAVDARFDDLEKRMDQKFIHLEMKMDERFKRTDLKMNVIIGLSLLAMTLFNPRFMDIIARFAK